MATDMDLSALKDRVWSSVGIRKHAVGRATVDRAVKFYVGNWPVSGLTPGRMADTHRQMVDLGMACLSPWSLSRGSDSKRYGFIWTMLLSAVLSQVVAALIKWWLQSEDNKELMYRMRELRRIAE
jgi:hypothetical protein